MTIPDSRPTPAAGAPRIPRPRKILAIAATLASLTDGGCGTMISRLTGPDRDPVPPVVLEPGAGVAALQIPVEATVGYSPWRSTSILLGGLLGDFVGPVLLAKFASNLIGARGGQVDGLVAAALIADLVAVSVDYWSYLIWSGAAKEKSHLVLEMRVRGTSKIVWSTESLDARLSGTIDIPIHESQLDVPLSLHIIAHDGEELLAQDVLFDRQSWTRAVGDPVRRAALEDFPGFRLSELAIQHRSLMDRPPKPAIEVRTRIKNAGTADCRDMEVEIRSGDAAIKVEGEALRSLGAVRRNEAAVLTFDCDLENTDAPWRRPLIYLIVRDKDSAANPENLRILPVPVILQPPQGSGLR